MPQASDEDRAEMERMFGDPVSDEGPIKLLMDAGYTLTRGWEWLPREGVRSVEDVTEDEYKCLRFLIDEWDFGGLRLEPLSERSSR